MLQKNENYWNKDNVQLDYIVARMLDEQMAPVGMAFGDIVLTEGAVSQPENQTDTAGNTVEVPQLADTISAAETASNRTVSLVINANTGNAYLQDAEVRAGAFPGAGPHRRRRSCRRPAAAFGQRNGRGYPLCFG